MEATHRMRYTSGSGNQYDGGKWNIKETAKSFTFKRVKDGFFSSQMPECRISKDKERSHSLKDWGDGTYTIYPFQSGTPHYFEPI